MSREGNTNALAALMRANLEPAVTAWLNLQPPSTVWISPRSKICDQPRTAFSGLRRAWRSARQKLIFHTLIGSASVRAVRSLCHSSFFFAATSFSAVISRKYRRPALGDISAIVAFVTDATISTVGGNGGFAASSARSRLDGFDLPDGGYSGSGRNDSPRRLLSHALSLRFCVGVFARTGQC